MNIHTVTIDIGGRPLTLETGKLAKQAHGSVVVRSGNTMLLATAVSSHEPMDVDFLPLTVDYREKYAAAGRFPGGFFKREARPSDTEVLVMRLALRNLEAFVVTPVLLSRTVNLLPTVALTAQLSLGALLGLPGVLLALPLVVVLQVIMQQVVIRQIMDRWELSPVLPSRAAELEGSSITVENR